MIDDRRRTIDTYTLHGEQPTESEIRGALAFAREQGTVVAWRLVTNATGWIVRVDYNQKELAG